MSRAFSAVLVTAVAVLVAGGAAAETVTFTPDPIVFRPSHRQGDYDFDGNGPKVKVVTTLTLFGDREVHMSVTMNAASYPLPSTMAAGTQNYVLYRAPLDKRIVEIARPTENLKQEHEFIDAGHKKTYVEFGSEPAVRKYVITGDTKKNESGTETRVKLMFNPITVKLANRALEPGEEYAETKTQMIDIPLEHTKGNGNFSKHNMDVQMSARAFVDGRRVRCKIFFKVKEKHRDWTTVEGTKTVTIYTAPEGKKILGLPGIANNEFSHFYFHNSSFLSKLLHPVEYALYTWSNSRLTITRNHDVGPAASFVMELHPSGRKGAARTKASVNLRAIQVRIADSETLQPSSGGPTGTGSAPVQHSSSAPAPSGSSSPFPGH